MLTAPLDTADLAAALEPIAQQRIPGASRARITNWRAPAAGYSGETFLFELDGVDGPVPVLPLVFRRPPAHPILPGYDLRRQYEVMQRLAASPIPVPGMRWIDASSDAIGSPYYVMDLVAGVALTDIPAYHVSGAFAEADEAGRAAMWNACVDAIADIHRLDPDHYRLGFLRLDRFGGPSIPGLVGFLRESLNWARGDRPLHPGLARGLDWLDSHAYSMCPRVVCWGDSRMSNLLYGTDHTVAAVLDWELAHLGDPASDLAWMLMTDWMLSPHDDHAPAPGTPSREETLERYVDSTGNQLTNLTFCEVSAPVLLAVGLFRLNARMGTPDIDLADICARRIDFILDGT